MLDLLNNLIYPLISLIIATIIGGEIVRKIYSPKVKVKIKNTDSLRNEFGFLASLNITNLGSSSAIKSIGYIIINDETAILKEDLLHEYDACTEEYLPTYKDENPSLKTPREQWVTPERYTLPKQLVLCWNHSGDPYQMDVNPGVTISLNICRMQYHKEGEFWYIIFPTEKGWRRVRLRMRYKELEGKIFICPSNAYPTVVEFKLTFNKIKNEPMLIVNPKELGRYKRNKELKSL